jgi:hypothetical protein
MPNFEELRKIREILENKDGRINIVAAKVITSSSIGDIISDTDLSETYSISEKKPLAVIIQTTDPIEIPNGVLLKSPRNII